MIQKQKSGNEKFYDSGQLYPFDVLSFWKWSSSDLLSNALRGMLAEFIVASALGIEKESVRKEWDAFDLQTADGIKIEVKSAAYLQSWPQIKLSKIQFDIRPTQGWDAKSNTYSTARMRQADVYVFCVLSHKDKETVDPLDLDQWDFYVVRTEKLNSKLADQKTVCLSTLQSKVGASQVGYQSLESVIRHEEHETAMNKKGGR